MFERRPRRSLSRDPIDKVVQTASVVAHLAAAIASRLELVDETVSGRVGGPPATGDGDRRFDERDTLESVEIDAQRLRAELRRNVVVFHSVLYARRPCQIASERLRTAVALRPPRTTASTSRPNRLRSQATDRTRRTRRPRE